MGKALVIVLQRFERRPRIVNIPGISINGDAKQLMSNTL